MWVEMCAWRAFGGGWPKRAERCATVRSNSEGDVSSTGRTGGQKGWGRGRGCRHSHGSRHSTSADTDADAHSRAHGADLFPDGLFQCRTVAP